MMFNTCIQLLILVAYILPLHQCTQLKKKDYYWIFCLQTTSFNGWYEQKAIYSHTPLYGPAIPKFHFKKLYKHIAKNHRFTVYRKLAEDVCKFQLVSEAPEVTKNYTGTFRCSDLKSIKTYHVMAQNLELTAGCTSIDLNLMQQTSEIFYKMRAEIDASQYVIMNRSKLLDINHELVNYRVLVQNHSSENQKLKQEIYNVSAKNEALLDIIKHLQQNEKGRMIAVAVSVVVSIICMVITVISIISCRNLQKSKIHHLKPMHEYVNDNKFIHNFKRDNNCSVEKSVDKKQIERHEIMGRWQHEPFSEMLDNSQMVQNVIMGDIVDDMQAEGHIQTQIDKKPDELILDGTLTRVAD
eukprot:94231_1